LNWQIGSWSHCDKNNLCAAKKTITILNCSVNSRSKTFINNIQVNYMLKKIKLALLLSTSIGLAFGVQNANAEYIMANNHHVTSDIGIKLNGFAHFQAGFLTKQDHLQDDEKNVSAAHKSFAFYNDVALVANVYHDLEEITYGAKLVMSPTAKRKGGPKYNGSHLYLESEFGRMEFGAPYVASATMAIDGSDAAAGTFDGWSRYSNMSSEHLKQGKKLDPSFASSSEFFLDGKLTTDLQHKSYSSEPARSIAYYTPKFEISDNTKIQFGLSYTPDSSNTGADSPSTQGSGIKERILDDADSGVYKFVIDSTVKDVISAGVNLEQNLSDGVDVKIGVTGASGKSVGKAKKFTNSADKTPIASYALSDLKEVNIGAMVNVGNMAFSASYGTLGNSLTSPEFHKTGRKTNYYAGTVAYKQAGFVVSLSYFKGEQFKNKTDAVILGSNYKLAPGLSPYFEIASFKLTGKPEYYANLKDRSTKGVAVLTGLKLSF